MSIRNALGLAEKGGPDPVNIDRVVGVAQILLSISYIVGYFWVLHLFIAGHVKTPIEWKDQVSVLMGVLTTGVPMVLQFWFARARPHEKPPTGQP